MALYEIQPGQIRAARGLLDWNQSELARQAGVSLSVVKRIEAEGGLARREFATVLKVIGALEAAGIEFTNGDQPGVKLCRTGQPG